MNVIIMLALCTQGESLFVGNLPSLCPFNPNLELMKKYAMVEKLEVDWLC